MRLYNRALAGFWFDKRWTHDFAFHRAAPNIDRDVLAEKPDLVIWQVGTNAVLRDLDPVETAKLVNDGVARIQAAGADLVLVDPQFTLKSPDAARYERFVRMVDDIGASDHVPVLSRYAMMKRFAAKSTATIESLLSRDGLHMNDLGYRCLAHALAEAIEGAAGAKL